MRNCCFTDFLCVDRFNYFDGRKNVKYGVVGLEICPNSGREHLQGYVEFDRSLTMATIKKLFNNPALHVEKRKGTSVQAADYCKKDGKFVEVGTLSRPGTRNDISSIKKLIDEGAPDSKIAEADFGVWCKFNKSFALYRSLLQPQRSWKTEVRILWGEPGSGKSRVAFEAGAAGVQFVNGFFIGYTNQPCVVFDDFTPEDFPFRLLLKLCDRYPMRVNVKGGDVEWNPRCIFITSNQNPRFWYDGVGEWTRRITSIDKFGARNFLRDDYDFNPSFPVNRGQQVVHAESPMPSFAASS